MPAGQREQRRDEQRKRESEKLIDGEKEKGQGGVLLKDKETVGGRGRRERGGAQKAYVNHSLTSSDKR